MYAFKNATKILSYFDNSLFLTSCKSDEKMQIFGWPWKVAQFF